MSHSSLFIFKKHFLIKNHQSLLKRRLPVCSGSCFIFFFLSQRSIMSATDGLDHFLETTTSHSVASASVQKYWRKDNPQLAHLFAPVPM
jgi:cation transport regulator ChaB